MRLIDAKTGATLTLHGLPEDSTAERQVRSLGLIPGSSVRLIRRAPFHGPLLLEVQGRVIALGWKIASGLEVSPAPDPGPEGA